MHRGHPPEDIRDYAWRDIEIYLTLAPILEQRSSIGGMPEE